MSVAPRALGGGGQLSYKPGSVSLGEQVRNRTVLRGGINEISNLSNVIGSVVDIRGTVVNGVCQRPDTVGIMIVEPGRILKPDATIDTKALSQIWFSEIIDKQRSIEAGYLAFTANMSQSDRAEVIIEDVASQSIANFDTSVDPARLKAAEERPLPQGACGRYVITRAVGTSVKHRILYSRKIGAGIGGHQARRQGPLYSRKTAERPDRGDSAAAAQAPDSADSGDARGAGAFACSTRNAHGAVASLTAERRSRAGPRSSRDPALAASGVVVSAIDVAVIPGAPAADPA